MVIKEEVYITPFLENRTLHIYVPDDLKKDERCPVIYMFDGHNLFFDEDATYGTSWGLKDTFERYGVKVIVVGIECNHIENYRLFEFSPYSFFDEDYGAIEGFGKVLFEWMITELKPYIDAKYPTLPKREHTAIGGSSMGGLMALYGAVAHSAVFSRAIAASPYTFYVIHDILDDIYNSDIIKDTTIYLSFGAKEVRRKSELVNYVDQIFKIQRALDGRLHLLLHIFKGHDHSESSWQKEVKTWLKELHYIEHY